jgi:hypothetical protein
MEMFDTSRCKDERFCKVDEQGRSTFEGFGGAYDEMGRRFCIIAVDGDGGFGKEVGAEL